MNGFNLLAALWIGPAFLARFGLSGDVANLLVTSFPLTFSSIFFAVPGGRALKRSRAARRLAEAATRAKLIGEVISRRGAPVLPETLLAAARRVNGGDAQLARRVLDRLLVELDGDVTTDDEGRPLYSFPRVGEETTAAERARSLAPASEREAGQVVFSSADDDETDAPASLPKLVH